MGLHSSDGTGGSRMRALRHQVGTAASAPLLEFDSVFDVTETPYNSGTTMRVGSLESSIRLFSAYLLIWPPPCRRGFGVSSASVLFKSRTGLCSCFLATLSPRGLSKLSSNRRDRHFGADQERNPEAQAEAKKHSWLTLSVCLKIVKY